MSDLPDASDGKNMRMLGLIGGISWVSTSVYYRLINQLVNRELGGSHSARCVIYSFDYDEIQKLNATQDWDRVLGVVGRAAECLRNAGAEGLVLCANTMHLIADRLAERVGLPVIHIAAATASEVRRAGCKRVGLLGTRFTMEMDFFKERLALQEIEVLLPGPADRSFIHDTIFSELGNDVFREETRRRYRGIIRALEAKGAEGVVLGCTEIPLLVSQDDARIPLFDTTALHAQAAVEFSLRS